MDLPACLEWSDPGSAGITAIAEGVNIAADSLREGMFHKKYPQKLEKLRIDKNISNMV